MTEALDVTLTTHTILEHPVQQSLLYSYTDGARDPRLLVLAIPAAALSVGAKSFSFRETKEGRNYRHLFFLFCKIIESLCDLRSTAKFTYNKPCVLIEHVRKELPTNKDDYSGIRIWVAWDNYQWKKKKDANGSEAVDQDDDSGDDGQEQEVGIFVRRGRGQPQNNSLQKGGTTARLMCPSDHGALGKALWKLMRQGNREHRYAVERYETMKQVRDSVKPRADLKPTAINDFSLLVRLCNFYASTIVYDESLTSQHALDHMDQSICGAYKKAVRLFDIFSVEEGLLRLMDAQSSQILMHYYERCRAASKGVALASDEPGACLSPTREDWYVRNIRFGEPSLVWRVRPEAFYPTAVLKYVFPFVDISLLSSHAMDEALEARFRTLSMYSIVKFTGFFQARQDWCKMGQRRQKDLTLLEQETVKLACERRAELLSKQNNTLSVREYLPQATDEDKALIEQYKVAFRSVFLAEQHNVVTEASHVGFRAMGAQNVRKRTETETLVETFRKARLLEFHAQQADFLKRHNCNSANDLPSDTLAEYQRLLKKWRLDMEVTVHHERCKHIKSYRDAVFQRFVDHVCYGEKVSDEFRSIHRWFDERQKKHNNNFSFKVAQAYNNLSLFATRIVTMLQEFEHIFRVTNHFHLLRVWINSLTAYLELLLSNHTLMWGPPATGKSHLIKMIQDFLIPLSYRAINYASMRAMMVNGTMTDQILILEDVEGQQIGLKGTSHGDKDYEAAFKSLSSSNTTSSITLQFDEDGNRIRVITYADISIVYIMASNANIPTQATRAVSDRFFCISYNNLAATNSELLHRTTKRQREVFYDFRSQTIRERMRRDQCFVAFLSKAVLTKMFSYDGSLLDALLVRTLEEHNRRGGDHSFAPRNKGRIALAAQILTFFNAIWRHFDDPDSAFCNKPFDWADFQHMEKDLVCTPEIAVFAITAYASEYETPLLFDVIYVLERDVFHTRDDKNERTAETNTLDEVAWVRTAGGKPALELCAQEFTLPKGHRHASSNASDELVNIVYYGLSMQQQLSTTKEAIVDVLASLQNRIYYPKAKDMDPIPMLYINVVPAKDASGTARHDVVIPRVLLEFNHRHPIEECLKTVLKTSGNNERLFITGDHANKLPSLPRHIITTTPEAEFREKNKDAIKNMSADTLAKELKKVHVDFSFRDPNFKDEKLTNHLSKLFDTDTDGKTPALKEMFSSKPFWTIKGDIEEYLLKRHYQNIGYFYGVDLRPPTERERLLLLNQKYGDSLSTFPSGLESSLVAHNDKMENTVAEEFGDEEQESESSIFDNRREVLVRYNMHVRAEAEERKHAADQALRAEIQRPDSHSNPFLEQEPPAPASFSFEQPHPADGMADDGEWEDSAEDASTVARAKAIAEKVQSSSSSDIKAEPADESQEERSQRLFGRAPSVLKALLSASNQEVEDNAMNDFGGEQAASGSAPSAEDLEAERAQSDSDPFT